MFLKPDCIPCILNMSLGYLHKLFPSEAQLDDLYTQILNMPPLRGQQWDVTSPAVIEPILERIMASVENDDPLSSEKEKQNKRMMTLYPKLKDMAVGSGNPLKTAAHMAILGNAIDVMLMNGAADVRQIIADQLARPLNPEAHESFQEKLSESKLLLYFGDNAGEIVLDRLFIEILLENFALNIVYVVRGVPALNDATLKDAMAVGMNRLVKVMENGIDGPLPGTRLHRCSKELNDLYRQADLIISKGGGNFDTLEEEQKVLQKNITFMLLSKCRPYQERFGVERHGAIIYNSFHQ